MGYTVNNMIKFEGIKFRLTALALIITSLFNWSVSVSAQTASQLSSLAIPATGGNNPTTNINELELRDSLLELGGKFLLYFALVFSYWLILKLINWAVNKTIKSVVVVKLIKVLTTSIFIISALVTILFAFVGNLTFLITSFGVLSAALVVALQDFVSSFFAWMMIKIKQQYKVGDIIELNSSKGAFTGRVIEIGIFRTTLKEKIGGEDIDKEFYTGKINSFPNNLILKEGVVNHTLDNKILWNAIDITVTFESDYEKAKIILEEIANKQFLYALDHKDTMLDDVFNLKTLYKPKIYMSIGLDGVEFTIWFATRIGQYRDSLEEYSRQIMHKFKAADVHLAYKTHRVISSPMHQPVASGG